MDIADKGILFLDEIGEIDLHMQVKLLRAIEGNGYTPVGGSEIIKPDVRILAATSQDLAEQVKNGNMRKDFFYRVHIIPIHLPPLRERKDDIPLLIQHFLKEFNFDEKDISVLTPQVKKALQDYNWPGNIRELQNVLQRLMTIKRLDLNLVPDNSEPETDLSTENLVSSTEGLKSLMENYEKQLILDTLEKNNWRRLKSASKLNINRKTLFKKMKQHGL